MYSPAPVSRSTSTDGQGRFSFKDVEAGSYRLAFSANGYVRQEYGQRAFPGNGSTIALVAGQAIKDLAVALTPAGSVSGTIRDTDRRPLAGMPVQLLRYTYDDNGDRMLRRYGVGETDDRGEYRIYFVTPGRYYVNAGTSQGVGGYGDPRLGPNAPREFYSSLYYSGAADPKLASTIDIPPEGNVSGIDFTLDRPQLHAVRGRIIDSQTGQPPEKVRLRLNFRDPGTGGEGDAGGREASRPTYLNGAFEFRNVLPGAFSVVAMIEDTTPQAGPRRMPRTGYAPVEVSGSDVDGVVITVSSYSVSGNLRVEGQASVASAFLDGGLFAANLKPLVNAERSPKPGMIDLVAEMNTEGSFRFDGVPGGEYGVSVTPLQSKFFVKEARFDGKDVLSRPLQFSGNERGILEIVVSPNVASVEGVVTNNRLAGASGAQVVLVPDYSRHRPELFKTATTDQEGRFKIPNIAPGDYKLYAWETIELNAWFDLDLAKRYEQYARTIHLTESSTQTIDAKLIPASQ